MSAISDIRKKVWPDRTPLELCITQSPSPQIRTRAAAELAALREAGEKMAERLRVIKELRNYEGTAQEDAAALAEWEAANK